MTDWEKAAECLRILSHPQRLKIIDLLLENRLTVGELAQMCGLAQNVTSEHLNLMKRCQLLNSERKGRSVYYFVQETSLSHVISCMKNRFGEDHD